MKEIRGMVLVSVILLLGSGCATRSAEPASAAGSGGATPAVAAGGDAEPHHENTIYTAMLPRDGAMAAAKALNEKFGLEVGSGGNYNPNFNDQNFGGDHFSASAAARTSAGGAIQMDFEWIKEGETKVGLSSDLPDAQYDAVVAVIRSAIGATDKK